MSMERKRLATGKLKWNAKKNENKNWIRPIQSHAIRINEKKGITHKILWILYFSRRSFLLSLPASDSMLCVLCVYLLMLVPLTLALALALTRCGSMALIPCWQWQCMCAALVRVQYSNRTVVRFPFCSVYILHLIDYTERVHSCLCICSVEGDTMWLLLSPSPSPSPSSMQYISCVFFLPYRYFYCCSCLLHRHCMLFVSY